MSFTEVHRHSEYVTHPGTYLYFGAYIFVFMYFYTKVVELGAAMALRRKYHTPARDCWLPRCEIGVCSTNIRYYGANTTNYQVDEIREEEVRLKSNVPVLWCWPFSGELIHGWNVLYLCSGGNFVRAASPIDTS